MATLSGLLHAHPEVGVVALYLVALGAHVVVGASLHAVRLRDFDWHKLGAFVEQDFSSSRGKAILVAFVLSLVTQLSQSASWKAAFGVSLAGLVAACGAATLPVVRDTLYELVQLVSGVNPAPAVGMQAAKV